MARAARPTSLLAALAASIVCAMALAAPAAAAWETPATTLAPYRLGTWNPSVSLDRDGNALALWTSADVDDLPDRHGVYATSHPLGGAWAPLTEVWSAVYVANPTLAGNAAGDAVAAWIGGSDDYERTVHVSERSGATGAWDGHRSFGIPDVTQERPAVAINDRGNAVAVWTQYEPSDPARLWASTRGASGWSEPVPISEPNQQVLSNYDVAPRIAIAPDGTADVVWGSLRIVDEGYVQDVKQSRFDGTGWSAPTDIATDVPGQIMRVELAEDGAGDLAAAWLLWGHPVTVQAAWRTGGSWTVADVPAEPRTACSMPLAVSAGPGGRATVAWQASDGALATVSGARASWEQPRKVYTPTEGTLIDTIALRERFGHPPVAAWTTVNDDDYAYSAAGSQLTASGWQAPTVLAVAATRTISPISVDVDRTGRAIAAWTAYNTAVGKVQAAWASGVRAPVTPPTPGAGGGPGQLNPPFVRVRGGLLRLPRKGRTLTARLINREKVVLRGTARLVHFDGRGRKGRSPMRTIAVQRKVRVGVKNPSKLRLKLSRAAIERLRKSRRHAFPARLYLDLRAPDGRTVKTTQTFTLDGWSRFGKGKQRPPLARKSC